MTKIESPSFNLSALSSTLEAVHLWPTLLQSGSRAEEEVEFAERLHLSPASAHSVRGPCKIWRCLYSSPGSALCQPTPTQRGTKRMAALPRFVRQSKEDR